MYTREQNLEGEVNNQQIQSNKEDTPRGNLNSKYLRLTPAEWNILIFLFVVIVFKTCKAQLILQSYGASKRTWSVSPE